MLGLIVCFSQVVELGLVVFYAHGYLFVVFRVKIAKGEAEKMIHSFGTFFRL